MKLIHSTPDLMNVIEILNNGLRPAIETGKSSYQFTKDSKVVCFSALRESEDENISTWGGYHLVLNPKWFRENTSQFREHGDEFSSNSFRRFIEEIGLQPHQGKIGRAHV